MPCPPDQPSCRGLEPHLGIAKELVAKSIRNRDPPPNVALLFVGTKEKP